MNVYLIPLLIIIILNVYLLPLPFNRPAVTRQSAGRHATAVHHSVSVVPYFIACGFPYLSQDPRRDILIETGERQAEVRTRSGDGGGGVREEEDFVR